MSSSGAALNLSVYRANGHVPERNCAHRDLCLLLKLYFILGFTLELIFMRQFIISTYTIYQQTICSLYMWNILPLISLLLQSNELWKRNMQCYSTVCYDSVHKGAFNWVWVYWLLAVLWAVNTQGVVVKGERTCPPAYILSFSLLPIGHRSRVYLSIMSKCSERSRLKV